MDIQEYLKQNNIEQDVEFNASNVIYNLSHPKASHVANFIVLIAKQFIYRCKCENRKPNTRQILNEIEIYYKMEKYNAIVNDKMGKHLSKWSYITNENSNTHEPLNDFIVQYIDQI